MSRQYNSGTEKRELLFGKMNFLFIIVGMLLVVVGFLLMSGGNQPDPNTWLPEEIYSSRRITLAPFVVVVGLAVIVVAIFLPKKNNAESPE